MSEIVAPDTGAVGSIPIPILGSIQNLLDFLVNVPLIGSLFKGKTQHVDYNTALTAQRDAMAHIGEIYDSVDAQGQAIIRKGADDYWNKYVLPGFGSWWNGKILADSKTWAGKGWLDGGKMQMATYSSMPLFYFIFLEDATRVKDTLDERYTSKIKYYILDPLQKYLEVTYSTSVDTNLEKYKATGKSVDGSGGGGFLAGFSLSSPTTMFVIVGVLIGGFLLWKKS